MIYNISRNFDTKTWKIKHWLHVIILDPIIVTPPTPYNLHVKATYLPTFLLTYTLFKHITY
jgi:hypothetical protein